MIALLATAFAMASPSQMSDAGVLIGLRDRKGGVRTVLVAQKGVSYTSTERAGEIIRPLKLGVHSFSINEMGLVFSGTLHDMSSKYRISWVGQIYIGLAMDRSRPGEPPFTRYCQRVMTALGELVQLKEDLNDSDKPRFLDAAYAARKKASFEAGALPESPDALDWGFVRVDGKWQFVSAFTSADRRLEFTVPDKPPTMNPPLDTGEVKWRAVIAAHDNALDVVANRDAPFAVVLTRDYLYVHESTRTGLGRVVRRIPCNDERLVSAFWGQGGMVESWREFIRK